MIIKPPVVYVGTGYVHTRFEQWLVEQYRNICINVWYLEHSRKYPKVVEKYLKISDSILLDNGAVGSSKKKFQTWKSTLTDSPNTWLKH